METSRVFGTDLTNLREKRVDKKIQKRKQQQKVSRQKSKEEIGSQ